MNKSIEAVIFRGTILPWSLLIMLVTWSRHSHGMLEVSDGEVMEAVPEGVRKVPHEKSWYAWELRIGLGFLPLTVRQRMYQRALERQKESRGYDWRYYLAYLFNIRSYQDKQRDVCWEFVDYVLRPFVTVDKNPARVVGRHLLRSLKRFRRAHV